MHALDIVAKINHIDDYVSGIGAIVSSPRRTILLEDDEPNDGNEEDNLS